MALNSRELALNILTDINQNGAYSNISIGKNIKSNINPQDENLVREIVYGVIENKLYIDYIISKTSKVKLKKIHLTILDILRIGIYQIIFMDKIPDSAAVNESVNLAKKHGHKGTIGFVNGILRNISRNKEKFNNLDIKDKIDYISIKYSHPRWMVNRWIKEFGEEFTEELCKSNNEKPELNIRVNTLKISKVDLKNRLIEKGYIVKDGIYSEDCLIIENPYRLTELDEFISGYFIIQDESSMLVAQVMDPSENSFVLDVCSAPGGKSTHIAQKMRNNGRILSRDVYEHKINLVKDNAKRLGINIIHCEVFDALKNDSSLINKVDHCLIDAPCSGLGLIRRKPEIKWNKEEKDIKELSDLQYRILENVKGYIKIGGTIVYSTCTIEKDENINLINKFLKNNDDFRLVDITNLIKNKENIATLDKGFIQLFPNLHHTDGFFIAKMIKER